MGFTGGRTCTQGMLDLYHQCFSDYHLESACWRQRNASEYQRGRVDVNVCYTSVLKRTPCMALLGWSKGASN